MVVEYGTRQHGDDRRCTCSSHEDEMIVLTKMPLTDWDMLLEVNYYRLSEVANIYYSLIVFYSSNNSFLRVGKHKFTP